VLTLVKKTNRYKGFCSFLVPLPIFFSVCLFFLFTPSFCLPLISWSFPKDPFEDPFIEKNPPPEGSNKEEKRGDLSFFIQPFYWKITSSRSAPFYQSTGTQTVVKIKTPKIGFSDRWGVAVGLRGEFFDGGMAGVFSYTHHRGEYFQVFLSKEREKQVPLNSFQASGMNFHSTVLSGSIEFNEFNVLIDKNLNLSQKVRVAPSFGIKGVLMKCHQKAHYEDLQELGNLFLNTGQETNLKGWVPSFL